MWKAWKDSGKDEVKTTRRAQAAELAAGVGWGYGSAAFFVGGNSIVDAMMGGVTVGVVFYFAARGTHFIFRPKRLLRKAEESQQ